MSRTASTARTPRATRRSRFTRLLGAAAVAGALAFGGLAAAAPATAAPLPQPAGNLPGCVLPAGVHWQVVLLVRRPVGPGSPIIIFSTWTATGAGHTYGGRVSLHGTPPDVAVASGLGAYVTCNVLS